MTIDKALRNFASFLNNSWDIVSPLLVQREYTSDEESINDWLQANWEILVERKVLPINQYLEVYGEGADFNGMSSRITDIDAVPNFRIKINSNHEDVVKDNLNNEFINPENLEFFKFVNFKNDFYLMKPDFDYVLLKDKDLEVERVVSIIEIRFELESIL